jgi:nitroimidazol reductase NimA-like FMN-containing flavoprotein (pyridoxamine 5'-phosphate oxidase superfamily)
VSDELAGAARAFVDAARVARLGTVTADGGPHVVPVCPVLDLDRIVFSSSYDRKVANIRDNPAVCIAFDEYSEDWVDGLRQVIVFGTAYLVESGPEWERDRNLLNEKFPQYPVTSPMEPDETVMVEIRPVWVSSSGL